MVVSELHDGVKEPPLKCRTARRRARLVAVLGVAVMIAALSGTHTARAATSAITPTPIAETPSSNVPRPPERDPSAPCTCATAQDTNGRCERHGFGYVAGVKIRSRYLYDTLDAHGHALNFDTFQCPGCQKAIASDGYCEKHRLGFVGKLTYFSRLTYELAKGERKDPAKIACSVCRKNARRRGWCATDQIGMVGKIAIKGRESYQYVSKAIEILEIANEAAERCETCAAAIVTDTGCPLCRINYKDGRPVPPASRPPALH